MTLLPMQALLTSLIILLLGFFVLVKDHKSKINIVFFFFCLSVFIWLFSFSLMYLSPDENMALKYAKIGDIGILYLPIFAYYFTLVLLDKDKGAYLKLLKISFISSVPILILNQSNYFFVGLRNYNWGHYPLAGPLYVLLILFFSLYILSMSILYYALAKGTSSFNQRKIQQIRYVLLAYVGGCTGFVDYLPKYNIDIYPWGHISVLLFISIIAYAILKHHLMDINMVLRKGLIFSAIGAVIVALYFVMVKYSSLLIVNGIVQPPLKISYMIFALSAFILHACLGSLALFNNPRKTINRLFALLSIVISIWIFGCFIQIYTNNYQSALLADIVLNKFAVFAPALFLHTFYEAVNYKNLKIIIFGYIASLLLLFLSFTGLFALGISYNYGARYLTNPGSLYFLFPLVVTIDSLLALSALISERTKSFGYRRIQLDYLLLAGIMIDSAVFFYFLLIYKVIFTPFDNMLNMIYGITMAYAILKHRLMDIKVVFRKGLIYSVLIGLLAGAYISGVYLFTNYLGGFGGQKSILFSIFAILIFAILSQPLRDKIQELIDKVFFKGKYDYQKTLKSLSLTARSIAGIDELADKIINSIVDIIQINKAALYILDKKNNAFTLQKSLGEVSISLPNKLVEKLIVKKETISFEVASNNTKTDCAIVFPILSKEQLVGILCLGEKLSGDVYSDEDIDLLTTLCNQMGVSIENAMLYEDALEAQKRLFQADKLATLGALAAGLAHEIKNPIAAIKGFSQVIDKAVVEKDADAIKDFKDVVPRQLDRINEIVEKLLTLSKPPKLEIVRTNITNLLDEIIKLVEKQALKQRIVIVKSFDDLPQTMADPEQLTQAFLNLILNAMQSMPNGGQIEIRTKLIGTDKITVEIADNGTGISKDKISKIFDPFYTTKESGSGLGLAVTQKIILDHHGKIEVESEVGKGTEFRVILPVK